MALGTGQGSAENGLGAVDFELGVIAGNPVVKSVLFGDDQR